MEYIINDERYELGCNYSDYFKNARYQADKEQSDKIYDLMDKENEDLRFEIKVTGNSTT